MQATLLFTLLAAAAVSATDNYNTCQESQYSAHPSCAKTPSEVYKEPLPKFQHYDCDATDEKCYAPASYGGGYKHESYKYGRKYEYPGPKERFCRKLKKVKHGISKVVHAVGHVVAGAVGAVVYVLKKAWIAFVHKWRTWCGIVKSDAARFKDWLSCKVDDWKDWWEHYIDLCRTRKALWDDAMREFHRQWKHYKKCSNDEYKKKKKDDCKIEEPDYDETPEYKKDVNTYGLTPVEKHYGGAEYSHYKQETYVSTCKARDDKYAKENNGEYPSNKPAYNRQAE
jgi:hypothetical protein